ncbi:MAG: type I restriction enzyme HsdR N-terminal domain-containing protein [Methylocystaceae bacterium]|nr:type I restriction enzyme HsdR N-terminal domain-containing protein [Methylocystaceae bacterium]
MDLSEEVRTLAKRAKELIGSIETEEATKTALVLPMLRALGYDVFNPLEVVPEFNADVGIKKGEKVDYAIYNGGKLSVLIECKKIGEPLAGCHANQLYRYFTVTEARFGILTNGIIYEFYSDLDERNKMDNKPFFIFDILSNSESDLRELKKFGKVKYQEDTILSAANNLKYARLLHAVITEELENPSEEFVKLLGTRVYEGRMTSNVLEWMSNLVKDALAHTIRARVRANLESALDKGNLEEETTEEVDDLERNGVITTEQEIESFNIVRAILSEVVETDRIFMRDSKTYCAIIFDDNNRKPICRLYLDGRQWRVGTFEERQERKNDINQVSDIFKLKTQLKAAISRYEASS